MDSSQQYFLGLMLMGQILDGLLTYSRVNDPTFASGDGQPPQHLKVGGEGKADVKDGGNDQIVAELNGRVRSPSSPFAILYDCETPWLT